MKHLLLLSLLASFIACQPIMPSGTGRQVGGIDSLARVYFGHYRTRADWDGYLQLFADDMHFQDVILRLDLEGKDAFADFYNWPDTGLVKHPDYPEVLVLTDLATTDSTAIGMGHFNPFYYNGRLYADQEHMRFCIQLTYSPTGLITRQVDFIEYPPEVMQAVAERLLLR